MNSATQPAEQMTAVPEKQCGTAELFEDKAPSLKEKASLEDGEGAADQGPTISDQEWREKEKALVRRLDMTFMPLLWILYFHNYLDRNNIA
jgi:hypothetical protein